MTAFALLKLYVALGLTLSLSGSPLLVNPVVLQSCATFSPGQPGTCEEVGDSDRTVSSNAAEGTSAIRIAFDRRASSFQAPLGGLNERLVQDNRAALPRPPVEVPCFDASAWREADALFRRDPRWLGSDVASSVSLGGERVLWLFGDTWIDPSGAGTRRDARMVSNSVAIQSGTDPTNAEMNFYWGTDSDGRPTALFADRSGESLWLGNGVRVGDRLVLFFARTRRNTGSGLGFEHTGWSAVMVENPDEEPPAWQARDLETPPDPLGILVGFAASFQQGDFVYALGSRNPVKSHPIYAARWPVEEVRHGDLRRPMWWAGESRGWIPDTLDLERRPLFDNGQSELTIHEDHATQRLIAVQTLGFGPADIAMRAAPTLSGPWSAPRIVYRPPEYYRPNAMIYAAKAHPELTGGDLILTYATNTFEFAEQLDDSLIYYPRFVRLTRCRPSSPPSQSDGRADDMAVRQGTPNTPLQLPVSR